MNIVDNIVNVFQNLKSDIENGNGNANCRTLILKNAYVSYL